LAEFMRTHSSRRRPFRRARDQGQSVVEFALVLPVLVMLLVGVLDLARIWTTMLSVESAAREAADFGTFGAQKWIDPDQTAADMEERACTAASNLPDYQGPDTACTNPRFQYELSTDRGATWMPHNPGLTCDDPTREPPCMVRVTLEYDFKLLIPLRIEAMGTAFGLPEFITFERSSVFQMTDMEVGSPSPASTAGPTAGPTDAPTATPGPTP
jgi:Flp pilus assembly protein TadG